MSALRPAVPIAGSREAVERVVRERRTAVRLLRPVLLAVWLPSLALLAWALLGRDAGGPLTLRVIVVVGVALLFLGIARHIPRTLDPAGSVVAVVRGVGHADEDRWLRVAIGSDAVEGGAGSGDTDGDTGSRGGGAGEALARLPRRSLRVPEVGEHVLVQPDRRGTLVVATVDAQRARTLGLPVE